MNFVTSKKGFAHFTSNQFRKILESVFGEGSYIVKTDEMLAPDLASNNIIKLRSGVLIHHGGVFEIPYGTYDEVEYQNGTLGMKRIDLVVARASKNPSTKIETGEWVVIQGESVEENPVPPAHVEGNMQKGDLVDDCPLLELHFDGLNITEVKVLVDVGKTIEELEEELAKLNSNFYDTGWIIQNGEYCQYRVKNGICTVKGISDGYMTLTKGEYTHIGTVWSDCCPSSQLYFQLATFIDDCSGVVRIDTDGKIYVQCNKDGVHYWAYGFTYFI